MSTSSRIQSVKMGALVLIYVAVAAFMVFVAVNIYQYEGGVTDIGTIAVVVAMALLALLMLRTAVQTVQGNIV